MTIAISLQTPEGIVLGADSTTTVSDGQGRVAQLFNSAQKIFEIGPRNEKFLPGDHFSGGIVTFNDGSFGPKSWRTVVNEFYREVLKRNCQIDIPYEFLSFAQRKWADLQKSGMVPGTAQIPNAGFHIACMCPDGCDVFGARVELRSATIEKQQVGNMQIGGGFEVVSRLLFGYDQGLIPTMQKCGLDVKKFEAASQSFRAIPPLHALPLRDAVDFVHFLVYSAIKLHRYRGVTAPIGGAIEIAAVTPDRGFRWILHKPLQESIGIPRGSGSP